MSDHRSLNFLTSISLPSLSLAIAFGVNSPNLYHLVLTRLAEDGAIESSQLNSLLGTIGIVGLITSGIAQPLVGLFSDRTHSRLGRRFPYMFFGGSLMVVAMLWEVNATSFATLVLASVVVNFSLSAVQSPVHAMLPDHVPNSQHGLASGLKTVLELVGVIAGGAIVWLLLGEQNYPELVVLVLGLIMLVSVLVAFWVVPAEKNNPQRLSTVQRYLQRHPSPRWHIYLALAVKRGQQLTRRRTFTWWLVHRTFLFGAFGILGKFTISYLTDVFGFSADSARALQGQLIVILGVLIMATPVLSGYLSDRFGRRRMIIVAGILSSFSTFVISQTSSLSIAVVMMAITGIGTAIFFTVGWALVTNIVPTRQAGFYMGITNIATSFGSMLGLSGGFVVDHINNVKNSTTAGYMVLLMMASLFYFLSALAIYQTTDQPTVASRHIPETITAT
jgi:MFS family permease